MAAWPRDSAPRASGRAVRSVPKSGSGSPCPPGADAPCPGPGCRTRGRDARQAQMQPVCRDRTRPAAGPSGRASRRRSRRRDRGDDAPSRPPRPCGPPGIHRFRRSSVCAWTKRAMLRARQRPWQPQASAAPCAGGGVRAWPQVSRPPVWTSCPLPQALRPPPSWPSFLSAWLPAFLPWAYRRVGDQR